MSILPARMAKFGMLMELESDDAIALGVVSYAFCTLFMPSSVRGDNWDVIPYIVEVLAV